MADKKGYERHKQPWTQDELQTLHRLAAKGMSLRSIAKALKRTEESTQNQARALSLKVVKLH